MSAASSLRERLVLVWHNLWCDVVRANILKAYARAEAHLLRERHVGLAYDLGCLSLPNHVPKPWHVFRCSSAQHIACHKLACIGTIMFVG
jgi:hypothetical protein